MGQVPGVRYPREGLVRLSLRHCAVTWVGTPSASPLVGCVAGLPERAPRAGWARRGVLDLGREHESEGLIVLTIFPALFWPARISPLT
jgi:hypothetical protein